MTLEAVAVLVVTVYYSYARLRGTSFSGGRTVCSVRVGCDSGLPILLSGRRREVAANSLFSCP